MHEAIMRVLVIGSGGREHALAWRMLQDEGVECVHVAPGNPGMKIHPCLTLHPLPEDEAFTFEHALQLVKKHHLSFVVIGPEKYLFEGWIDQFQKHGIPAYGPSQKASMLEHSKIQSKQFMKDFQIRTAGFETANSLAAALQVIDQNPKWNGYVLKLSGPALGKGVIVTSSVAEAKKAAEDFFNHRPPGIEEGMVIEEKIEGREVSLFYVCAGDNYQFLASACDHKRLNDGDQGPNTGGMGAYSPASWFTDEQRKKAESEFVLPTLQGMKKRGHPFFGTLFLGLMVRGKEAFLLEYNTRFGDPETQTFLPLLTGNFTALLFSSVSGGSLTRNVSSEKAHAVHVVKAAHGYPGLFGETIESGQKIEMTVPLPIHTQSTVFFAGVKEKDGVLYTRGGRVLGLTHVAATIDSAREGAYQDLSHVSFKNEHFRKDIARS